MFEALQNRTTAVTPPNVSSELALKSYMVAKADRAYYHSLTALSSTLANASESMDQFRSLRLLRDTISNTGINKSFLKFAKTIGLNTKNDLLNAIESLDSVMTDVNDPRVQDTVDDIDEDLNSEPDTVSAFCVDCADQTDDMMDSLIDKIKVMAECVTYYYTTFTANPTPDATKYDTMVVSAVPYDVMCGYIDVLSNLVDDYDIVVCDSTNADAVDAHHDMMTDRAAKLGPMTGMSYDRTAVSPMTMEQPTDPCVKDTLSNLGYTCENITNLLHKTTSLVDSLSNLTDRKDDLINRIKTASTMVTDLDNEVMPVDNVADEDDTPMSSTQASTICSHLSSHMMCMTTMVNKSVDVVGHTLDVSQCMYEMCGS